jgi:hypothetical protein
MKKIFALWVVVLTITTLPAQKQGIVELFVDNKVPEYDSLLKIMDQENYNFVAYHYSLSDTLKQRGVLRMMDWHNTYLNPFAFVNGKHINDTDLLNPAAYQSTIEQTGYTNNGLLYAECKWVRMPKINHALDIMLIQIKYNDMMGYHIMGMITETFPGTRYKNVFRKLVVDDVYYGDEIKDTVLMEPNWNPANCKLLVMVETLSGQCLSSYYHSFVDYFTGTDEVPLHITAYPNPVRSVLTIQSEKPLSFIRIINSSGVILDNLTVSDCQYQYPMDGLPVGLYFIQTANKTFRIIKNQMP